MAKASLFVMDLPKETYRWFLQNARRIRAK